jgi:DNA-binding beta-propeller fold protein YncE
VAVDGAGNVYIADTYNNAIKEWSAATHTVTTLVSSGLSYPTGVAVDGAGNVYIADYGNNAIKEWSAATHTVTTLVSSGLNLPAGVAVDGAGNVYIADSYNSAIKEWSAATHTVTTLVSSVLYWPYGVAVDGAGNVYIADYNNSAIKELPRAFVDAAAKAESALAGSDSLPVVLPATQNLTGPFAPTSDADWLTFSGVTNGVVSFAFTANTNASSRTGNITVLGQTIPVTQAAAVYSLGATNLLEGPAAGSDSVVLSANTTWTASTNAAWLHLSAANQSGTGSTNVVFTFDANPGATRTGTLTIAGQTVSVTQAGVTYVAAGPVTLVDSGLNWPMGVAVDGAGYVYIADTYNNAVKKWSPANNGVTTLVDSGLNGPSGVAVDGAGNVYIADSYHASIKKWSAANGVTTLVSSELYNPKGVAVDGAGNVYFADYNNNTIKQWSAATHTVTTLVDSGLSYPYGVAVDGAGNVYFADYYNNAIKQWSAASGAVTTLVSGLNNPLGVAVDGAGNVYIADSGNNAVKELPRAFVDRTAKTEPCVAGSDVLPVVLPATQNLTGPFAPASDSTNWLTINGVTNGVVSFAFTANTNTSARTGNITVLGQSIAITQTNGVAVTPPTLTGASILASGAFKLGFTAPSGVGFTVLTTTNLALSVTNWTVAGTAVETPTGSGQYQFSDPAATNGGQRFYRVRSP